MINGRAFDFTSVRMLCAVAGISGYDNSIITDGHFQIRLQNQPAYAKKSDGYFIFVHPHSGGIKGELEIEAGGYGWLSQKCVVDLEGSAERVFFIRMLPDWRSGSWHGRTVIAAKCPAGKGLSLMLACSEQPFIASERHGNLQIFHQINGLFAGMEFFYSAEQGGRIKLGERIWHAEADEKDPRRTTYQIHAKSSMPIPDHTRLKPIYRLFPGRDAMVYFVVPCYAQTDAVFSYTLLEAGYALLDAGYALPETGVPYEGIAYKQQAMRHGKVNWISEVE